MFHFDSINRTFSGQSVLDLSSAVESFRKRIPSGVSEEQVAGAPSSFELPILLDSNECGKISGEIQLLGSRVRARRYLSRSSSRSACFQLPCAPLWR